MSLGFKLRGLFCQLRHFYKNEKKWQKKRWIFWENCAIHKECFGKLREKNKNNGKDYL